MTIAGHTRVLWVLCRHDDGQAIKALKTTVSELAEIAHVVFSHRYLGRENQWAAVFANPVFSDDVRTLLKENGYPIQAESVVGTPYPMPVKQEVPAA